jgi:hypothetical protein
VLFRSEEVAIELANVIFGIRDGDYDEPEKFKFKFEKGETYVMNIESFNSGSSGDTLSCIDSGRYRTTKEGAELSLKRNQRANRLEMLVEYHGGLKEFVEGDENWFVYYYEGEYRSTCIETSFDPEKVYMPREVSKTVCNLLNSGAYSLDGE